jgi:hypothetical protein
MTLIHLETSMFITGRRDLLANRWEPFVHVFRFEGVDLTGAVFAAEVRDRKDGGFARATLATVGSVGTEGISLVSVAAEDVDFGGEDGVLNVPVSTVSMRINEPTVEAMNVAPEAGADGQIWWDMQITPAGGVKFRALQGSFTISAGVTGSAS